jgi:2-methylcitrate dehydratase PrpD
MTDRPTHALAGFVAGLDYEHIPGRVTERVKDLLLDAVASALAGRRGDESAQVRAVAEALGGPGPFTVIGGEPLSLGGATLLNGYLITAVTVCDVHRPTLCHVTPEVVPPAIATAEASGATGRDLLVALAAGLETTTRVGLGTDYPAFRARGWHSPGVIGPFGGSAAAGKLLGLDVEGQRNAFGLAGSQAAGTFAQWGTPTIKFHQARAALSGVLAAQLAAQGFTASDEVLPNPDGGIFNAYSDGGRPEAVTDELGERWELENISLRLWPLASSIQSVATALFALIETYDLRPAGIARVRVRLSETVYSMHGTLPWDTRFHALLSAPYATSVILHDRQCTLDQFSDDRIEDTAVDAFARERVQVESDPAVEGTGAVVEVTDREGKVLVERRKVPRGDAADPLRRDEIAGKFRDAAAGVISASAVEAFIERVASLEDVGDVRAMLAALRSGVARPVAPA